MGVKVLQIAEVKLFSSKPHQPFLIHIDG
jgi:hypothetical protein